MTGDNEITDGLQLYRKLIVYVRAITGIRDGAGGLVQECLSGYTQESLIACDRILDSLLSDLTERARRKALDPRKEGLDDFPDEMASLSFDERASLALHANFGMEFARIAAVMGIPEDEAVALHDGALEAIRRSLKP